MTRLAPAPSTRRSIGRRSHPPFEPVAAAVGVATAYVEVRAGRRGLPQLRDVLTQSAYRRARQVVRRQRLQPQRGGGISLRHVVSSWITDDALEVTVVLRDGPRVLAVAVRLDRRRGLWGITDIALPEDRHPLGHPTVRPVRAVRLRGTS